MTVFEWRYRLTLAACVLAFVVVGLGAFTRLVDAGLGCPDWPGCYGHLMWPVEDHEIIRAEALFPHAPVDNDKTWPEMVHRYFAGTLGMLILALAILAVREGRGPRKLPWALVVLVIVQAMFGMWTVTLKLWPQVVTAHLLGGFATLALLWLCCLRLRSRTTQKPPLVAGGRLPVLAAAGLLVVIVQIALGGWTSSNYAALACIDLPTCHGVWWPTTDFAQGFNLTQTLGPNYLGGLMDNDARTAIHLSHRIGAVLTSLLLVSLAVALWRSGNNGLQRMAPVLLGVLILQVGLGVSNILAGLPLAVAVAHNGVGALLLLTMVTINYQIHSLSSA